MTTTDFKTHGTGKDDIQLFPEEKAKVKHFRVRKNKPLKIKVCGQRDPRGPDNDIQVWLDEFDQLHIRVGKYNRCYQHKETINENNFVEVVAN